MLLGILTLTCLPQLYLGTGSRISLSMVTFQSPEVTQRSASTTSIPSSELSHALLSILNACYLQSSLERFLTLTMEVAGHPEHGLRLE